MLSGPSSTTWWTVLKSLLEYALVNMQKGGRPMDVNWTKFNHMVDGSKVTASVSSSQHAERRQTYGC